MFTGLVEEVGTIEQLRVTPAGRELRVRCGYHGLASGESIAINGACLTVREHGPHWFTVAAVTTTLERTTIGEWSVGRRVNLERAMLASARFGGHFVLGHVDVDDDAAGEFSAAGPALKTAAPASSSGDVLDRLREPRSDIP